MAATARERGGRFLYGRASSWLRRKRREENKSLALEGLMCFYYYYSDSLLRERNENAVCSYIFLWECSGATRVHAALAATLPYARFDASDLCSVGSLASHLSLSSVYASTFVETPLTFLHIFSFSFSVLLSAAATPTPSTYFH